MYTASYCQQNSCSITVSLYMLLMTMRWLASVVVVLIVLWGGCRKHSNASCTAQVVVAQGNGIISYDVISILPLEGCGIQICQTYERYRLSYGCPGQQCHFLSALIFTPYKMWRGTNLICMTKLDSQVSCSDVLGTVWPAICHAFFISELTCGYCPVDQSG